MSNSRLESQNRLENKAIRYNFDTVTVLLNRLEKQVIDGIISGIVPAKHSGK